MPAKPGGRVDRALVVSGGCLVRPWSAATPPPVGEVLCNNEMTFSAAPDELSFLRDAVHEWVHESESDPAAVICADRGFDHARILGLSPDLVVGDMDSVSEAGRYAAKDLNQKLEVHPSKKDASDTEIAVEHALSMGATRILMVAALGGRVDHELANIMLLVRLARQGKRAEILDNVCRIVPVIAEGAPVEEKMIAAPGDLLTLVPLSDECQGVSLLGLEYPLSQATLSVGTSRGVSNVFVESEATVALSSGTMLVIVTFAHTKEARESACGATT